MTIQIDQHINLELTTRGHAQSLYKVIEDNRQHLSQFLGWVNNMKSVEDTLNYLKNCELLYKEGLEVSFVIILDGEMVGRIGIHYTNHQNKVGAIGYWLSKNSEGNGIITKCCLELLNYGFKKLNLNRIEIKAARENYKSQAIPKRLNFVEEGVLRQAEMVNSKFHDLVLYSLLRSEWASLYNSSE